MKVICPDCGHQMVVFGVSEKGEYKYYCNECNRIELIWNRKGGK